MKKGRNANPVRPTIVLRCLRDIVMICAAAEARFS